MTNSTGKRGVTAGRLAGCLLLVTIQGCVQGCVTRTPPDPAFGSATTGVSIWTPNRSDLSADWLWPSHEFVELEIVEGSEFASLEELDVGGPGRLYARRWNRSFLSTPGDPSFEYKIGPKDRAWQVDVSGRLVERPRDADPDKLDNQELWYCVEQHVEFEEMDPDGKLQSRTLVPAEPDPTMLSISEPDEVPSRGTVVFLASLDGYTRGERALVGELKRRGWTIVWMAPSLYGVRELEFITLPWETLDQAATRIANRATGDLMRRMLAVDAALDYLDRVRPGMRDRPTIGIGCSAGAIYLPAVAARLHDRFDAAVLIGGGADLFQITTTSRERAVRRTVRIGGRPANRAELREVHGRVLAGCKLDPYHTAPLMSGVPILTLHASFDAVVPAATGDLLYERLGRPERWSYPLGHLGLFIWLPTQVAAICDWIDRHVPDGVAVGSAQE